MKKKWSASLLAWLLLFLAMPVGSAGVVIYAPDGRRATVSEADTEAYLALGWYRDYTQTIQHLYAPDGREATVYKAEVPAYLSLGWYASKAETVATIYADDGREMQVYLSEVPTYLSLGWYATKAETVAKLYAPDGREIDVYRSEIPAYLAVGWSLQKLNGPMLALTFDDGPHPVYTHAILDILAAYQGKATFFVLGCQVESAKASMQRAHAMGCEIGNHTDSHINLSTASSQRLYREIANTNAVVKKYTGQSPTLLRPPYGNYTAFVRTAAGLPLVLWNVDTQDWMTKNAERIASHIMQNAQDGNVILMHDIYETTVEAVRIAVPKLSEMGFRLVTVSELAAAKGYSLAAGTAYRHFR